MPTKQSGRLFFWIATRFASLAVARTLFLVLCTDVIAERADGRANPRDKRDVSRSSTLVLVAESRRTSSVVSLGLANAPDLRPWSPAAQPVDLDPTPA